MRSDNRGKSLGILTLAVLLLAGNAGAATLTVDDSGSINGSVWTESAPIFYWTHQNFAGFFYDPINNLGAENLTILADPALLPANRTIPKGQLVYSTMAQPVMLKVVSNGLGMNATTWDYGIAASKGLAQAGPGQAFDGGNYYVEGWQGQKYVALNGKVDKLTKLVLEQEETKNLTSGETWNVGEGWALTLIETDTNATPAQAWISLYKDGIEKDSKVISAGMIYTYVESSITGENNVPLFVTYAENVTENNMQLKYTWAISTSVTQITSGSIYGVFKNAQVAYKNLSLSNYDTSITLFPGSTNLLMDGLYLVVIDSPSLEFYPMMTVTPPPVNQPPVADFIYSPSNPVVNQVITFDASPSYDPDGNITGYWWNIGGNIFTTNIVDISFPAGGTYYAELVVTDNNGATNSTSKWIYVTAPPPANDDFNNATVISSLPFADAISTIDATTAFDDPVCYGNGHTVWYSFTPTENMSIEADTFGSNYDTTLSAYTGSRGALNQIACNDDFNGVQSRVNFDVYAGQTIFFMAGSFGGGMGGNLIFNVNVTPPPPPPPIPPGNDDFSNATAIRALPFIDSINTVNATTAFDDPYSCVGNYYGHTVWYSFTPAENMRIEANPAGSDYSPILLAAYQGSRGALYQVACNLVYNQPLIVYVNSNQTVFFMVGSYDGNPGGNLNLTVNVLPPLTINLSIDPIGSVNRLAGDGLIHGTLTCSRPAPVSISGELSQRAGRFNVIRGSFGVQSYCDSHNTTWNATVRGSNGPFNAGQASADAFASAYDWITGDYAADDTSTVVHLRGQQK